MLAVQITVRDIPNSTSLESHIREKAQKLAQYYHRIIHCRVVVEMPQKHKNQGKLFNVRIDVSVPGKELVVNRNQNEDPYIALRDALHAMQRKLEAYARKQRGDIKTHEQLNRGQIARLFPEEGYGFIDGVDGNEFYFSAVNVAFPHFERLFVGDEVQFLTHQANEGLQAQRVTRTKNHDLDIRS